MKTFSAAIVSKMAESIVGVDGEAVSNPDIKRQYSHQKDQDDNKYSRVFIVDLG